MCSAGDAAHNQQPTLLNILALKNESDCLNTLHANGGRKDTSVACTDASGQTNTQKCCDQLRQAKIHHHRVSCCPHENSSSFITLYTEDTVW